MDHERRALLGRLGHAAVALVAPVACAAPPRVDPLQVGPVRIWLAHPKVRQADRTIVVLHGRGRNARAALQAWHPVAETFGACIAAPEFTETDFPGWRGYNIAGMLDRQGRITPRDDWSLDLLGRILARVRHASSARSVWLYGHSAGAQLAHRFALFSGAGADRVLVANAGWYTRPDPGEPFPYGLDGGPTSLDLNRISGLPIWLLAGARDTRTDDPDLRRTPAALRQGAHRLARARTCFADAQRLARQTGQPLNWHLRVVPGVGHSNRQMALALLHSGVLEDVARWRPR